MAVRINAPDVSPEIVTAIAASINCVMETTDSEIIAAIAAVIHHAKMGGGLALRIKRNNNFWASTGRQKIMDGRQFA